MLHTQIYRLLKLNYVLNNKSIRRKNADAEVQCSVVVFSPPRTIPQSYDWTRLWGSKSCNILASNNINETYRYVVIIVSARGPSVARSGARSLSFRHVRKRGVRTSSVSGRTTSTGRFYIADKDPTKSLFHRIRLLRTTQIVKLSTIRAV